MKFRVTTRTSSLPLVADKSEIMGIFALASLMECGGVAMAID